MNTFSCGRGSSHVISPHPYALPLYSCTGNQAEKLITQKKTQKKYTFLICTNSSLHFGAFFWHHAQLYRTWHTKGNEWQAGSKKTLFLLFAWKLSLFYLNVENFLLLKVVMNNFQSKSECVCVYSVPIKQSKGTVLWKRIIFFHPLSVSILINVVFKTMLAFIFSYKILCWLVSIWASFLFPMPFKSLVQVSTSTMDCWKLYYNTTVLIICMQN